MAGGPNNKALEAFATLDCIMAASDTGAGAWPPAIPHTVSTTA